MHRHLNQQKYRITEPSLFTITTDNNNFLKLSISSIAVIRFLSIIGLCLIIASIIGQLYHRLISQDNYRRLIALLYVDAEKKYSHSLFIFNFSNM